MHCAFLRTGDMWKRTRVESEVLNHDGDSIIFNEEPDTIEVLSAIQEKDPTRFVFADNGWLHTVIITDHPLFSEFSDEAMEKLNECGKIMLRSVRDFVRHSHKSRVYEIAGVNAKRRDNVILERENFDDYYTATINPELWAIANKKVDNLRKKRQTQAENAKVTHPEAIDTGYYLASSAGFRFGNSNPSNLLGGIILHDAIHGEDKTNEHAKFKKLAAKWLKFKEENTERFRTSKWLSDAELKRLNERFEKTRQPETKEETEKGKEKN